MSGFVMAAIVRIVSINAGCSAIEKTTRLSLEPEIGPIKLIGCDEMPAGLAQRNLVE